MSNAQVLENARLTHLPIEGHDPNTIRGNSAFGWRIHPIHKDRRHHDGVDIARKTGTHVYAAAGGAVLVSKMQNGGGGFGNYVVIRHNGFDTVYAHLHMRSVIQGQRVNAGDLIGTVGSTGASTGQHLHFGICGAFVMSGNRGWIDPAPRLLAIGKGEIYVIRDTKMLIDGKERTVKAILVDGHNYVMLRDLGDVIDVEYDEARRLPIVNAKKRGA